MRVKNAVEIQFLFVFSERCVVFWFCWKMEILFGLRDYVYFNEVSFLVFELPWK